MNIKGKVALVTGGAKRVGRQVSLGLASRGCHVAITYNTSETEAGRTVALIRKQGVRSAAYRVDQRDADQVKEAVKQIIFRFRRLDVLVNNASSFYPTPFENVTEAQWEESIRTNLSGPWWFAQAAGKAMKRRGAGKIINIVDVSVFSPWIDYLPYSAAKGGLAVLTRGLAKVLAPEVQVNAIAPGPILFPPGTSAKEKEKAVRRTLLKRCGSPEDIAQAVLFLVCGTDFVTGAMIPVDGGRLLA